MNRSLWRGKRVLVTGHTGFKGSWLTTWLASLGAEVSGLALAPDTNPSLFALTGEGHLAESHIGDVRDPGAVSRAMRQDIEVVFHLAAQALVRRSYSDPVGTFATNILGTANVLEQARHTPSVRAVVIVTTDKCYRDRPGAAPYRETDELGGHDPYAASKACAELVTASFRDAFFTGRGVGLATARAGNVIGGGDWSADRLFPDIVAACAADRALLLRRPDAVRPWQHVLDPLHGYLLLAEHLLGDPKHFSGAWNFGPDAGSTRSVGEIARMAMNRWGRGSIEIDADRGPHETAVLQLDSSKAGTGLGWTPRLPLEEAVEWTVDWYLNYATDGAAGLVASQIASFEERLQ